MCFFMVNGDQVFNVDTYQSSIGRGLIPPYINSSCRLSTPTASVRLLLIVCAQFSVFFKYIATQLSHGDSTINFT